ncbi:Src substrate cortactin [Taenia crassiceps]|uniref:Src substrate cortactin n=1 Tax=Taenia crassiceps TaxID=6207 RepID=A0ABR4Q4G2_9CEST
MADDDDWGITPDYKNVMTEKEQRFGSQAVPGRVGHVDMNALIQGVLESDAESRKNSIPKASYGYGGRFGVEKDRMDKSAVGTDYHSELAKHSSQKDYSKGFGGRYGVQTDRQDKTALSYEHREELSKHSSQKDYAMGFGGKYGVQKDRVDASSAGYRDAPEPSVPHQSQQRAEVSVGQNRASELRARFEKLTLDQNKPVERPPRPQVGSLKPNIFTSSVSAEQMPQSFEAKKVETQEKKDEEASWKPEPVPKFVKSPSPEPKPEPEPQSQPTWNVLQPSASSSFANEVESQPKEEEKEYRGTESSWQSSQPMESTVQKTSGITAVAAYDFIASESDDLSFHAGDIIVNINKFDESWWFGCIGTRSGIFPANRVQEINSEIGTTFATEANPHPPSNITATALYDFVASQSDELSFKEGDEICDIDKFDESWWSGRIGDRFGIFPAIYVSEN